MANDIDSIGERTIISLAEVRNRYDPNNNGSFLAKIFALGDAEETVRYVSPYATGCEGGFVAVPEAGIAVLVCSPMGTTEWFYLGSTFYNTPEQAVGGTIPDSQVKPLDRADPLNFRARGEPLRYFFKGKSGGGFLISEEYNPDFFNKKVEIISPKGKVISLNDSPGVDSIVLDSGNNSRITLTDWGSQEAFWQALKMGGGILPPAALRIDTKGSQAYINRNSRTDILVKDGTELNVLNNSGGMQKWAPPEEEHYGNVNIQSKQRDVNIFTRSAGVTSNGRIFIECLNTEGKGQVIEIETHGTNGDCVIRIKSTGKLELASVGDIDIDCGQNLNIKAGNKLSLHAVNGIDMKANSNGNIINIDGPIINLNGGAASPIPPDITDSISHYGTSGVLAY